MDVKYGEIIIDSRATQLDRLFTYKIEKEFIDTIEEGMRVIVPFGRWNKVIKGLVININDDFNGDYELKSIIDILDDKPIISKKLIKLGLWMRDEYLATYLDALQPILPPGDYKKVNSFVKLIDIKSNINLNKEELQIVNYLKYTEIVALSELKNDLKISNINTYLNKLEKLEVIETTIDIKTRINIKKERWTKLKSSNIDLESLKKTIGKAAYKQREIAEYLYENKEIPVNTILEELNTSLSTIRALEEKDIIKIFNKEIQRNPVKKVIPYYNKHKLNHEQLLVFNRIMNSIKGNHPCNRFLIHGVTGSGKTEIYLQLVEEAIKIKKDSIILVPEISLTPQTIDRFVGRFGENVAVLHSKLSQGERFDQWRKIKEGKVSIVVGARSAIFAPFKNLGLIIIDEEHESTYKSTQNPKYDTIEVATRRAYEEEAFLVMGTATPSIEIYNKAIKGEIELLELKNRVNKNEMPKVNVIDMREELLNGNKSMFSKILYEELINNLNNKKQTILFLNRRGFATFVSCRSCGYVVKCNNCDISMTYHRNINKCRCHYCGVTEDSPKICPVCNSKYIKYFGIGTEKVEELTRNLFPKARIVRMDGDTTNRKGSYEEILEDMKNKKIDILIGTQMISKGLDFENVTLVGIIAADTTLNLPDFRSPEKAFQLITQVAGRAGRGNYKGKVVLQTYNPEHYSIVNAKNQDYLSFYNKEIPLRKEFLYPPFINIINILIYGESNSEVMRLSREVYNIIGKKTYEIYKENYMKYIIGPNPAPLERIKNNYRWQILLKVEDKNLESFKDMVKRVCIYNEYKLNISNLKFNIDVNPISIL